MLKKKNLITVVIVIVMLTTMIMPVYAETVGNMGIMVNNRIISGSVPYSNMNNTIMVPAKELAESLGGTFNFDKSTMKGILKLGENEIVYNLDNDIIQFNGKNMKAAAPMKIMECRIMIPAQFTAEKLGAETYISTRRNLLMVFKPSDNKLIYKVMSGDTLWIISQLFNTTIGTLKELNALTNDMIYVGQNLVIKEFSGIDNTIYAYTTNGATIFSGPGFGYSVVNYLKAWTPISIVGKDGYWYKVVTSKGNGYIYYTVTGITQDISNSTEKSKYFENRIPADTSMNSISYESYTIVIGDHIWAISEKFCIPVNELLAANNMSSSTVLYPGQILQIPVHNIPVKQKLGESFGEILDWAEEGQFVLPIGKTGKLIDFETGKSFLIKRTIGASHADVETLTSADAAVMKEIFGGYWNWNRRPFILEVDGRHFAVSVSGMPHGGVDGAPFLQNVSNRSDNWGYGPNYDAIAGNGMDGHFDIYFLNSLRHKDSQIDSAHQYNVMVAGGLR